MTFDKKWEIYKKANLPNWLREVGDKPPINTLLENKYDAFRVGWQSALEAAAQICESECAKGGGCDEHFCDCCYLAQKIRALKG